LSWIESYLWKLPFFVSINDSFSSRSHFEKGVPQGGILSPTLFNLYIADLPQFVNYYCIQYADDTNLIISDKDETSLFNKMNLAFSSCFDYFESRGLTLNAAKTEIVLFKCSNNSPLKLGKSGTEVQPSNSVKFLGFIIDNKLKLHQNIDMIIRKLCSLFSPIYNSRNFLPHNTKLNFYYAFAYSSMIYPSVLLSLCNNGKINELMKYQKKIVKCLFSKSKRFSWTKLLDDTKIAPISSCINHEIVKFMQKVIHNNCNPRIKDHFSFSQLHQNKLILQHYSNLSPSLYNIFCQLWNNLQPSQRNTKCPKAFSKSLH